MVPDSIVEKLEEVNLLGRGGAGFPTATKWKMVADAKADKKYVICNGSEGEPDVAKDGYLLENHLEQVVDGIRIALETVGSAEAYVYLRHDYHDAYSEKLTELMRGLPVTCFKETGGYLAGEETALLSALEGERQEPRLKPPFPTERGLFGKPTLMNNVETFYCVSLIANGEYEGQRLYSVHGDVSNDGVFELSEDATISHILSETKNMPERDFFVQAGGGGAGEILLPDELETPISGVGSIVVHDRATTDPFELMKKWADFFLVSNCDKCAPCREGVFRISEMVEKKEFDKEMLDDIFFSLQETSFCALGKGAAVPFKGLIEKVL